MAGTKMISREEYKSAWAEVPNLAGLEKKVVVTPPPPEAVLPTELP